MEIFNGTLTMIGCRPVSFTVCTDACKGHFTKVILFTKRGPPMMRPFQVTI